MGFGKASLLVLSPRTSPHHPAVAARMTCLDLIKAFSDARWIEKKSLCGIMA